MDTLVRPNTKLMILDHLDKIELSAEDTEHHFDARMALARLGEGLFWIYRTRSKGLIVSFIIPVSVPFKLLLLSLKAAFQFRFIGVIC